MYEVFSEERFDFADTYGVKWTSDIKSISNPMLYNGHHMNLGF